MRRTPCRAPDDHTTAMTNDDPTEDRKTTTTTVDRLPYVLALTANPHPTRGYRLGSDAKAG